MDARMGWESSFVQIPRAFVTSGVISALDQTSTRLGMHLLANFLYCEEDEEACISVSEERVCRDTGIRSRRTVRRQREWFQRSHQLVIRDGPRTITVTFPALLAKNGNVYRFSPEGLQQFVALIVKIVKDRQARKSAEGKRAAEARWRKTRRTQ